MSIDVSQYNIFDPKNLKEALNIMSNKNIFWTPLAGGTDLMVQMEMGILKENNLINIFNLPGLDSIDINNEFITLGALTTFKTIKDSSIIKKEFPMMIDAANLTGSIAIQNRGTIGGNIMNKSPAADTPPVLLAYGAEIELQNKNESRWLFYKDFHLDYKKTRIKNDELLTRIRIPRPIKQKGKVFNYYKKVGTRSALSISKICFAASATVNKGIIKKIKIGLGSVAPMPIRLINTESLLIGQIIDKHLIDNAILSLSKEICPINDIRSTKKYRLRVAINLLKNFLKELQ